MSASAPPSGPSIIRIEDPKSLDDERLADYRNLKEQTLKAASGRFIAESEMVVRKLLGSALTVRSVLITEPHLERLLPVLRPALPTFVAPQELLDSLAGFHVHRGCLAIGERPCNADVPPGASTVVVLEDLVDVDNVGAMARNAAAFGADALVLSPRAADPFYRKAIRVSMGSVFSLAIARLQRFPDDLATLAARHDLTLVGTVLDDDATPLPEFVWPDKVALLFGSEGPGLSPAARSACRHLVTVPMARDKADSLNVATAGALFLHAAAAARRDRLSRTPIAPE